MRGKVAKIRKLKEDHIYGSTKLSKFINKVMYDGKKSIAETVTYDALEIAGEMLKVEPMLVFEKAISNVMPRVEVKARRVGGANYQVPTPVNERRQLSLAIRWIVDGARAKRSTTKFAQVLAEELVEAYKGTGGAMKKREDVHRMAEANKAFAHLAWGANTTTPTFTSM